MIEDSIPLYSYNNLRTLYAPVNGRCPMPQTSDPEKAGYMFTTTTTFSHNCLFFGFILGTWNGYQAVHKIVLGKANAGESVSSYDGINTAYCISLDGDFDELAPNPTLEDAPGQFMYVEDIHNFTIPGDSGQLWMCLHMRGDVAFYEIAHAARDIYTPTLSHGGDTITTDNHSSYPHGFLLWRLK